MTMTDKQISFKDTQTAFASKSTKELRIMNILFTLMGIPELTKLGTFFIKTLLKWNFPIKKIIKITLFKQFCGGETLGECQVVINQLYKYRVKSIPDYAVEGESEERDFIKNTEVIKETISAAAKQKSIGFAAFKVTGIAPVTLLEKIQTGEALNEREEMALERVKYRIHQICTHAFQSNVRVLADAEESWIQEAIDELVLQMMFKFNKEKPIVYNTYQMYKKDSFTNVRQLLTKAQKGNYIPAVKLVRGAYMEKERERAKRMDYSSPIYNTKQETDDAYDEALAYCVKNKVALCAGSHNEESNLLLVKLISDLNILPANERFYFAQLYGMSDHISYNLAKAGYNVVKYLPFGPVDTATPYLFRRAEENKSVTGQVGRELQLIRAELQRRKIS